MKNNNGMIFLEANGDKRDFNIFVTGPKECVNSFNNGLASGRSGSNFKSKIGPNSGSKSSGEINFGTKLNSFNKGFTRGPKTGATCGFSFDNDNFLSSLGSKENIGSNLGRITNNGTNFNMNGKITAGTKSRSIELNNGFLEEGCLLK